AGRTRRAPAGARGRARPLRRSTGPPPHGEAVPLRGDPHDDARRRAERDGGAKRGGWMRTAIRVAALGLLLSPAVAGAQWPTRGWQDLSPTDRQRAWENYQRYEQLPEDRRRMIERRYQQFQQMP